MGRKKFNMDPKKVRPDPGQIGITPPFVEFPEVLIPFLN